LAGQVRVRSEETPLPRQLAPGKTAKTRFVAEVSQGIGDGPLLLVGALGYDYSGQRRSATEIAKVQVVSRGSP
jgi:hypothetical protein